MSNPFDAFDEAAPAAITQNSAPESGITPSGHANPFDAFDHPVAAKPSTGSDIVRGAGRGLIEGSGSILGMPADMWHMLDRGYQWAMTKGAEKMGILTPEQGAALRQPISDMETSPISSERINKHLLGMAKSAGADTSAPQTTAGQAAETVGSFLPSAAAFGASSAREVPGALAKYGLLPGATSEVAGQATKGTEAEPYARMAGAIAPAALGMAASGAARLANPTARAIEGLTPAQERQAQQLLDQSRQMGAPLTAAEAVQHVTGNATRAGDLQRVIEQSPEGGAIMKPFFAQRPGQSEAIGRQAMDQISPAVTDPYGVAPRVHGAAQETVNATPQGQHLATSVNRLGQRTTAEEAGNVIRPELQNIYDRREGMRNALAGQDYGAARAADYTTNGAAANPVTIQPVIAHIDDQLTSAKGSVAASLRRARNALMTNGQPDMSVTGLSNARNAITDQISVASRAGGKSTVRALDDVLGQLDSALEGVPAYGQARRNFAAASTPLAPFAPETTPGRIIDRDQFGRNYTMPTEKIAPTIESGGATGADQFLSAAANSPASRQIFGQYFSQKLLDGARNQAGQINPDALNNALHQNHDILQRFPEVSSALNRVADARRALGTIEIAPIGRLAATDDFGKQAKVLFDSNPLPGSERPIGDAVRQVAERDPEAAQQMTRMYLEKTFNEATQANQPGANQFGGPKFAAVVGGNPQQMKNLQAAITALPNGQTRWTAFQKAFDVFQAMGTRQPVGSQTAFNQMIAKSLEGTGALPELAATAASPNKWLGLASDIYRRYAFGQNTKQLAQAMVSGNVSDLRRVVQASPNSVQSQAALIAILAREGGQSGSSPQSSP